MAHTTAIENATTYTLVHNMGWDAKDAAKAVREYANGDSDDPEVEYVYEAVLDGRLDTRGREVDYDVSNYR